MRRAEDEVEQRISHLKIELDQWKEDDHWALNFNLNWTSLGRYESMQNALVLILKYSIEEVQKFKSMMKPLVPLHSICFTLDTGQWVQRKI